MPRHPPYTLSSLITFIDHRHLRFVARYDYFGYPSGRDENGRQSRFHTPELPGMPPRNHATDTGSFIRRKGARHSSRPDGKTKMRGGYSAEFLLSIRNLEPLFTCQRTSLIQDPNPCGCQALGRSVTWIFLVGFPTGGGGYYTLIWRFQGDGTKKIPSPECTGRGFYSTKPAQKCAKLTKWP
jgi:hypothetical protein